MDGAPAGIHEPWLDTELREAPGGPEAVRREEVDAVVLLRDRVWLSEKKRLVDEARLGGGKLVTGDDKGGEFGPRRSFSRWSAASHRVHGCVCESPRWPQPLCWVKLWKHIAILDVLIKCRKM